MSANNQHRIQRWHRYWDKKCPSYDRETRFVLDVCRRFTKLF
jgi:hypothetical protein